MAVVSGGYLWAFYYQLGAPYKANYWLQKAVMIKRDIAERTPGKRILVLSGSNAMFGVHSGILQQRLGRNAVNLGLHASLSLDYLFRFVEPLLRPGDTLVMPLEYLYYTRIAKNRTWFTNEIMAWDPDYFRGLPWLEKVQFIMAVSPSRILNGVLIKWNEAAIRGRLSLPPVVREELLRHVRQRWDDGFGKVHCSKRSLAGPIHIERIYSGDNIDRFGDIMFACGAPTRKTYHYGLNTPVHFMDATFSRLAAANKRLAGKGVRLLVAWPPTMHSNAFNMDIPAVRENLARLTRRIRSTGVDIVGKPEQFHYVRRAFLDNEYHLNGTSRALHTHILADELEKMLPQAPLHGR